MIYTINCGNHATYGQKGCLNLNKTAFVESQVEETPLVVVASECLFSRVWKGCDKRKTRRLASRSRRGQQIPMSRNGNSNIQGRPLEFRRRKGRGRIGQEGRRSPLSSRKVKTLVISRLAPAVDWLLTLFSFGKTLRQTNMSLILQNIDQACPEDVPYCGPYYCKLLSK